MSVLPKRIKRRIEWRLRSNALMLEHAQMNVAAVKGEIDCIAGTTITGMPKAKGGISDPTARFALTLAKAEEYYAEAKLWETVINATFEYFRGTDVGKLAKVFYSEDISMKRIASDMGVDAQTVSQWRERFVCTCALMAAEYGLLAIVDHRFDTEE